MVRVHPLFWYYQNLKAAYTQVGITAVYLPKTRSKVSSKISIEFLVYFVLFVYKIVGEGSKPSWGVACV